MKTAFRLLGSFIVFLAIFLVMNDWELHENQRKGFLQYCLSKGDTLEQCKCEWRKMMTGKEPSP